MDSADDGSKRHEAFGAADETRDSRGPDARTDSERKTIAGGASLLASGNESATTAPSGENTTAGTYNSERSGALIGRYKLLQQIGEGGFGAVFLAEQREPVVRRVALKIIKLGMDTRQIITRFEQERQALALMDHPNIAKVLDAGATETGRPYFVMELCAGEPITKYCDRLNLTVCERLSLFVQVCQAVQHAHQKGLIHRDIKPSNILVATQDDKPHAKVIDFGIAKATAAKLTEKTLFTAEAQFIGTPQYMSPEQAEGSVDIDTRTDVYALGVLLYELLTGVTPFDPRSLRSAAFAEMQRIIREVDPPSPSSRLSQNYDSIASISASRRVDPRKLSSIIRGELDWIVMKALEKDRTRRYESANGFAADVMRYLAGEPVGAAPPSAAYRLRKFVNRNRVIVMAGSAVAAALLIGVVAFAWQAQVARQQRDIAVTAQGLADEQRTRAEAGEKLARERLVEVAAERDAKELARQEAEEVSTFLIETFESPDPKRDGRTITVAETLDRAVTKLESDLSAQPDRRARMQLALASTYRALGLPQPAIALEEKVRDYYLATVGLENSDTLKAMSNLATSYADAGRRAEALKLGEQVLTLQRKVNGAEHRDTLHAITNLAGFYWYAGRFDEAIKLQEEALPLSDRVLGPEHAATLMAMSNLAASYYSTGRRTDALKLSEKVLELRRKTLGREDPSTLGSINNVAAIYSDLGRREDALKLREDALPSFRKVLGPEHSDTLTLMAGLANSYAETGRRDDALTLREDVLKLRRRVSGPEHADTLWAINNLAASYMELGRGDEAIKLQEELLTLRREVTGPEHPATLTAMNNLSVSYDNAGRLEDAAKLREEVLALRSRVLGSEHPDTLQAMHAVAISYTDAGKLDLAEAMIRDALRLARKALPAESSLLGAILAQAGWVRLLAGASAEAEPLLREALAIRQKLQPGVWSTFATQSQLGGALLGQKKYAEAEPLLRAGYAGLKEREQAIPVPRRVRLTEAADRLIALYTATEKPEELKEWQSERAKNPTPATQPGK